MSPSLLPLLRRRRWRWRLLLVGAAAAAAALCALAVVCAECHWGWQPQPAAEGARAAIYFGAPDLRHRPRPSADLRVVAARLAAAGAVGAAGLRRAVRDHFDTPAAVRAYLDAHAAQAMDNYARQRAVLEQGGLLDTPLPYEAISSALILNSFFPSYRDAHPHALTLTPHIDCVSGRYLVVDLEHGGFGVSTGLFIRKWLLALAGNLTAVHQPFYSSHPGETAAEQNQFWKSDAWEVRMEDLQRQCPPDSAVWKNQLDLSRQGLGAGELYEAAMQHAAHLYWGKKGGIVRLPPKLALPLDHNTRVLFHQTQWLLQVRWLCRNNPYGDTYLRPALLEAARGPTPVQLAMSIHIRRGDIMNDTAAGGGGGGGVPLQALANRYEPVGFYTEAANELLALLDAATPGLPRKLLTITVYSEGSPVEFEPLLRNLTSQGYRADLNLDAKTSRVFAKLAESEVNVLSVRSEFSHYWRFNLHHLRVGLDEFNLGALPVQLDLSAASGFTVAGYDFRPTDPRGRAEIIRQRTVLLWQFLVEWKLRRAEAFSLCTDFTLRCLLTNPYTFPPVGPIAPDLFLTT